MRRNVLINLIFTAGTFALALILLLFSSFIPALEDFIAAFFFFGIIFPLLSCFSWARIIEEYGFRAEKFFKVLFWIGGIIGLLGLLFVTFIGFGTWHSYNGTTGLYEFRTDGCTMLFIGLGSWLALLINSVLRNFPSLFPSTRDKWPRLFWEDYGFMILLPFSIGVVCLLANTLYTISFYFTILLVWNLLVIFFFVFFKCRYQKVALGYIIVVLTAIADACLLIFLFNSGELFEQGAKLFENADFTYCVACSSFFLLALVICGPFYFIIEKIDRKLSRNVQSLIFFIVPLVSFGLQFLVFKYWWVGLIAVAIGIGILFLIALFTPPSYRDYVYEDDDGDYYIVRHYY